MGNFSSFYFSVLNNFFYNKFIPSFLIIQNYIFLNKMSTLAMNPIIDLKFDAPI